MLFKIQNELKAPKGQFNAFGKYRYRSAEDIIESVKPILFKHGYCLIITDEMVEVGGRVYVQSTARISNGESVFSAVGFAREEENKKGMDCSQITGAASSYARKYALNGLFAIDDTKDADSSAPVEEVSEEDRMYLITILESSKYDSQQKDKLACKISTINKASEYIKAKTTLLNNQL